MNKKLRVFYGWAKINKIRKKRALSVIFENDTQNEVRTQRFISLMQKTVHVRLQTEEEKQDAIGSSRMFTEYGGFLDGELYKGDLETLLETNFTADKNHVSVKERNEIREKLKAAFIKDNPEYQRKSQQ